MADATISNSITLPQQLCDTINYSMMTGMPVMITYWDEEGSPSTSWRGSTHVHGDGRLAMWIRSKTGGLIKAVDTNPQVRLAYRNPHTKSFLLFSGEARVEYDDSANTRIYEDSPPMERASDPKRLGIGVVIDVKRVSGSLEGKPVMLEV